MHACSTAINVITYTSMHVVILRLSVRIMQHISVYIILVECSFPSYAPVYCKTKTIQVFHQRSKTTSTLMAEKEFPVVAASKSHSLA